jgi:hypothetical protein
VKDSRVKERMSIDIEVERDGGREMKGRYGKTES